MVTQIANVEYSETAAGKFTCSVEGKVMRCVSCNKPVEYVQRGRHFFADHHCSEQWEKTMEGVVRRERGMNRSRVSTIAGRLNEGLAIMSQDD